MDAEAEFIGLSVIASLLEMVLVVLDLLDVDKTFVAALIFLLFVLSVEIFTEGVFIVEAAAPENQQNNAVEDGDEDSEPVDDINAEAH